MVPEYKPDWLDNDIVQLMRKGYKMYKEARRKKDPTLWRKATFLRNRVEISIKTHKRQKVKHELQQHKTTLRSSGEKIILLSPIATTLKCRVLNQKMERTPLKGKICQNISMNTLLLILILNMLVRNVRLFKTQVCI